MALIKPTFCEKEKIKVSIDSNISKEIQEYCAWAKINESDFFEQAAMFIFKKDRDWTLKKKSKSHS